jgi:hypothetical protein
VHGNGKIFEEAATVVLNGCNAKITSQILKWNEAYLQRFVLNARTLVLLKG